MNPKTVVLFVYRHEHKDTSIQCEKNNATWIWNQRWDLQRGFVVGGVKEEGLALETSAS